MELALQIWLQLMSGEYYHEKAILTNEKFVLSVIESVSVLQTASASASGNPSILVSKVPRR